VFQDETSPWSALFYGGLIWAARFLKKPVFLLDQGFEIKKPALKKFLSSTLKNASMISARDDASFRALKNLGLNPLRSADSVFQVQTGRKEVRFPPEKIGIIPRGNYGIWEKIILQTKEKWPGATYKTAVMSPGDLTLARKILEKNRFDQSEILHFTCIKEITEFIESADMLLLAPYHSVLFAVLRNIPFMAVPYSVKIENFLKENNLKENIFTSGIKDAVFKKKVIPITHYRIAEETSFQFFLNLLKTLRGYP